MEKADAIIRIRKLMAVAMDASATEQEVLSAIAMANRLRIRFKIEENELISHENTVDYEWIEGRFYGCLILPLKELCNHFRCDIARSGRLNGHNVNFYLIGNNLDREFCLPIIRYLIVYLENKVSSLDKQKERFSYLVGFRDGLKKKLEESTLELGLSKEYEIAVIGVPEQVRDYVKNKMKKSKVKGYSIDIQRYVQGFKDGNTYNIN